MIEQYRVELKEAYLKKKDSGELSLNLINPTPANIRNECVVLLKSGCSEADLRVFKSFFEHPLNADFPISKIWNFNIGKLKALSNFLKLDIKTNDRNLALLAVLIDFNPRPFSEIFISDKNYNSYLPHFNLESEMRVVNTESSKEKSQYINEICLEWPSGVRAWVDATNLSLISNLINLK